MDKNGAKQSGRDAMKRYLLQVLEVVILLIFVAIAGFLFAKTLDYTMPFVLGLVFALLLNPIVVFLERRGFKRSLAILTSMVITFGVLFALLSYTIVKIAQEVFLLTEVIPSFVNRVSDWMTSRSTQSQFLLGQLPPQIVDSINKSSLEILDKIKMAAMSVLTEIMHVFAALPEWIVIIVIGLIAAYFFLNGKEKIIKNLCAILPPTWDSKISIVLRDVNRAFIGLIRAEGILLAITIVFAVVGLLLLQVNYAITLGVIIGIAGFVPVVGTGLIIIPWAGYEFFLGDLWMAVKLLTLQALIVVVRHVIEPKIFAENVGLDTLSTLFAMYVGLRGFGVIGLFLGPIILIGIRSLLRARIFADIVPSDKIIE
ncbi:sporulation integral membrane protein YtvI [Collibacillus ludicampi]|uniref:Sporulation integral membrane protein YtvI n=1 Tax=Collibacillus ludicampi TaxID=2771369 RepID=A0AAV4LGM8_9BACL|nr:sporulation integral membrane protein YtvI [Collibacillus ludicampi]GIM46813.1 sporulation integral membrane protein YtvI [Collibacillus ludicampi]